MKIVQDQKKLEFLSNGEHSKCLMCGGSNAFGLKLRFRVQDDGSVIALFQCKEYLQSYEETLHGGVISALLDSAMTNALFSIEVVAVTVELKVRFLSPVILKKSALVRGKVEKTKSHPLYNVYSEIEQDNEVKAKAWAKFMVKGFF